MPILQQKDREAVQRRFDTELKRDVDITLYTQGNTGLYIPGRECRYCGPTQELVEEVSVLSPKIHLEVVDIYRDQESAASRGVDRIPALVIGGDNSGNAKFFGMPSGFEFALLLDSIVAASSRRSPLQLETRRRLRALEEDVHIRVFVTPSCKYCPTVARVAHLMALESPRVKADVIEIQEFPDLAGLYRVMGVPKTVINDSVQFTGAVSEEVFVRRVLQAVGAEEPDVDEVEAVSDQTTPIA
jgi:glutaredoxin-like protein